MSAPDFQAGKAVGGEETETRPARRRSLWAAAALAGLLLAGVAGWRTRGPLTPAEAARRRLEALQARGWDGVEFHEHSRTVAAQRRGPGGRRYLVFAQDLREFDNGVTVTVHVESGGGWRRLGVWRLLRGRLVETDEAEGAGAEREAAVAVARGRSRWQSGGRSWRWTPFGVVRGYRPTRVY